MGDGRGGESAKVAMAEKLVVKNLNAYFYKNRALHDVSLSFEENRIAAIIGPSGCGKSTLVRCLNRMHEVVPGATATGEVILDGNNIYGDGVDPVQVRRRIGMVFQKPTPFPTMSIEDNVAAGLTLNGVEVNRAERDAIIERSLRQGALWEEVKDRLRRPGGSLSGGQQQRLCVARALAVQPEVLLMDEPCSALDPISTARIEELLLELKSAYTIVIVTHNMQQAARCSDMTAFMYTGDLIEYGETKQIFTNPTKRETEDYITGPIRLISGKRKMDNTQPQHTNRQYEEDLRGLRAGLLKMGGLVERQIAEAVDALVNRDSDHAREVIQRDEEVNRMDNDNDEQCIRLLALHQPTASDLRFITTGLKITTDLERIGDNAVNICERTLELNEVPQLKPYIDLPRMAEIAQSMVKDSIDAFMRDDTDLADQVIARDDEVDLLNYQVYRELLSYMAEDPHTIASATRLLFVSKYLERIADHATNIAEMVTFMVKGKMIRHVETKKRGT